VGAANRTIDFAEVASPRPVRNFSPGLVSALVKARNEAVRPESNHGLRSNAPYPHRPEENLQGWRPQRTWGRFGESLPAFSGDALRRLVLFARPLEKHAGGTPAWLILGCRIWQRSC
jgi:hypothetical protein